MTTTINPPNTPPIPASRPYYDLGTHTFPITTASPPAQTWFSRGLVWAYSFNHDEAARCFEQVVAHDPSCAMGYWGAAFSYGPNYNKPWKAFDAEDLASSVRKTHALAGMAGRNAGGVTPLERGLIDAIQLRFDKDTATGGFEESTEAYGRAMRTVYTQFGEHLDVIALAADALMNTTPWKLFEARTGNPIPSSPVHEVKAMLERGLSLPGAKKHPGLLHMYIHLMEMSRTPEAAVKVADCLRGLVPDGGHMQHMPSHIDVLIGDYRRAIDANMKASIADDKYFSREKDVPVFYSFYRLHNLHSLIYAAMLAGQSKVALDATGRMEAAVTEGLLRVRSPPMADWIEFFLSVRVHVLIRFGMWEELKRLPIPEDGELYCVTTASRHYGRGIALAVLGDLEKADEERGLFRAAVGRVPASRLDFPNKSTVTLQVASAMLDGELSYRKGNTASAFTSLRLAVSLDDALVYAEPWSWMMPTRHPLAALLLEQNMVQEAASLYAEDLGLGDELVRAHQHPNNVWALCGYHECLVRLGRSGEARVIGKALDIARAGADVFVGSSCFCRIGGGDLKCCL